MLTTKFSSLMSRVYVATSAKYLMILNSRATHFEILLGLKMHHALCGLRFSIFPPLTTEPVKVRVINHVNMATTQRNHYG